MVELDAELAVSGGAARFDADDGYAVGPPAAVFPAIARFAARLEALGLELQVGKCACYSPRGGVDGYPVPAGSATAADGQHGFGDDVGGVPVGDATFVAAFMAAEVQKAVSKITTVTDKLRDLHLQSLYAAMVYS